MDYLDLDYAEDGEVEYAEYYDDESIADYISDFGDTYEEPTVPPLSLNELYEYCIVTTIGDSYKHLLGILAWSLLFLLSSRIVKIPNIAIHLCSSMFGLALLWQMFDKRIGWIGGLWMTTYFNLLTAHYCLKKWRGLACLITGVVYMVACEVWIVEPIWWHALRGIQMIVLMKIVSLGHDIDSSSLKDLPGLFEVLGYVFTPGTVIFGPWISYEKYSQVLLPFNWSFKWAISLIMKFCASIFFLILSTCFTNWIIPDGSNKWLAAYRDALSFRASHYFVSYLSEVSSSLSGIEEIAVSKAFHIELPRSLVDVVVNWNIPMHQWFKKYVFLPLKSKSGPFIAILLTYAVSTLFHGLNFQFGAVLLSLGFYTYTEHRLRGKLSVVFNACILARPCVKCKHKYKSLSLVAIIVNIIFAALTAFHLAYLGMMFDSSKGTHEGGFGMVHTLRKWQALNYSSHWIILSSYSLMSIL